jgi:hypothetical protein
MTYFEHMIYKLETHVEKLLISKFKNQSECEYSYIWDSKECRSEETNKTGWWNIILQTYVTVLILNEMSSIHKMHHLECKGSKLVYCEVEIDK